ncbi:MAG: sugar ABC transporter permease [Desulfocapsaceae bacterium]
MLLSLLVICLVFGVLTEGIFFYPRNIALLARQTTIVGVLAIGMMFVIVAGHIDLSVGSVLGFCGTLAGVLQVWMGWPTLPTIILVILTGMICGAWHGYWVAYRRVPAFIITLGGLLIFKGAKFGLSKSMSIAPMNPSFSMLGQSYIPAAIGWILALCAIVAVIVLILRKRQSKIKYNFKTVPFTVDAAKAVAISMLIVAAVFYLNKYRGIPAPVLIMVVLALIFAFVANSTVFGRSIYAIGGNREASSLSGIKTKLTTLYIFIISGGLAAVAGIILTARLDAATPAAGDTMELDAIAACIIGGTNLMGGSGKVSGVIVGALVMASLDNGMSLINLENYWQFVVKGLVLTFAVWASTMSSKTA